MLYVWFHPGASVPGEHATEFGEIDGLTCPSIEIVKAVSKVKSIFLIGSSKEHGIVGEEKVGDCRACSRNFNALSFSFILKLKKQSRKELHENYKEKRGERVLLPDASVWFDRTMILLLSRMSRKSTAKH